MEMFLMLAVATVLLIAAGLDGFGVVLFLAAIIGGLWVLFGALSPVIMWIAHNPLTFSAGLGIYLTVGIAWSFFKWYQFVVKNTGYVERIKSGAKDMGISPLDFYLGRLPENVNHSHNLNREVLMRSQPSVLNHIDKLSTWWVCWPTSVIRYIVGDFLYDITKNIVKWFGGLYTQVTEYAIKSLLK